MEEPIIVEIQQSWIKGMNSLMLDYGQTSFEAAVVKKGNKYILSTEIVDKEIVPKIPGEPEAESPAPPEDVSGAAEAVEEIPVEHMKSYGLTPVYRDAEGKFCTKMQDADGAPEFYLEDADDEVLGSIIAALGLGVSPAATKDEKIEMIKQALGS